MEKPKEFNAGEELGRGAESKVVGWGSDEESEQSHGEKVLKLPIDEGFEGLILEVWQTVTREHLLKGVASLKKHGFRVPDFEIHENAIVINKDKTRKVVKRVIVTAKIKDIDKKVLVYEDLIDPKHGPQFLRELVKYVRAANQERVDAELGYDPLGGEIVIDALKGIFQRAVMMFSDHMPESIAQRIENCIGVLQFKIRNILKEQDKAGNFHFLINDPGMHDFSKNGKLKFMTFPTHYLAFACLTEVILRCNQLLPPEVRLVDAEFVNLPYRDRLMTKVPAKILWWILSPLFERHKKMASK